MKTLFLLLLSIYPCFIFASDWRAFTLESDPWFAIQTTGNGKIDIKENIVTVKINSANINGTNKIADKQTLTELQVGIAYYKSKGNWLVSALSAPKSINKIIQKDTKLSVSSFETTFIVPKDILNQEHWVVLQMTLVNENGKKTYVFTHEPD